MKNTRQEVLNCINDEREYQERKFPMVEHLHELPTYLMYIKHYLNKAEFVLCNNGCKNSQEQALSQLRKIAALGVAAMEQHGIVERKL
jgi:hypothetical protein